jgi:hypothetical protein
MSSRESRIMTAAAITFLLFCHILFAGAFTPNTAFVVSRVVAPTVSVRLLPSGDEGIAAASSFASAIQQDTTAASSLFSLNLGPVAEEILKDVAIAIVAILAYRVFAKWYLFNVTVPRAAKQLVQEFNEWKEKNAKYYVPGFGYLKPEYRGDGNAGGDAGGDADGDGGGCGGGDGEDGD